MASITKPVRLRSSASALARVCTCTRSAIGVPIGMTAGYVGGWVDALISRITDAMLACPFLILAIALAAFLERGPLQDEIATRWAQADASFRALFPAIDPEDVAQLTRCIDFVLEQLA